MKIFLNIIGLTLLATVICYSQTKRITGRVINEDFEIQNGAAIQTIDSLFLTRADNNGNFTLDIPFKYDSLLIWMIGMETETISIKGKCHVNVMLANDIAIEFATVEQTRQYYLKRKENIDKKLLNEAYQRKLLVDRACFGTPNFLHGTLINKSGLPINGCNVLIKGTLKGTVTDKCGRFTFEEITNQDTIIFSCMEVCLYAYELKITDLKGDIRPIIAIEDVKDRFKSDCKTNRKKKKIISLKNY